MFIRKITTNPSMKINALFLVNKLFNIKKRIIFDEDIKKRVLIFSPEAGLDAHFNVKRMVCEIIDDNAFKIKTGMFSNWYAGVKKEIGLA